MNIFGKGWPSAYLGQNCPSWPNICNHTKLIQIHSFYEYFAPIAIEKKKNHKENQKNLGSSSH